VLYTDILQISSSEYRKHDNEADNVNVKFIMFHLLCLWGCNFKGKRTLLLCIQRNKRDCIKTVTFVW